MTIKARYAFVPHILTADPDAGPTVFTAQCTACPEAADPSEDDREPVELWALAHTGRTGHQSFTETITRPWRARPTP